ncbi:hypothetical protein [Arthrobacter sp. UYEF36]|uniref:hypothetical protein n=1 Tax=Arthrobacter sp. UYEF36 TaxID=1756366 RepID=UPI0033919FD7
MTRPDPNSPDSSANQDDAVWLDLVARLEGRDTGAGLGTPDVRESNDDAEGPETSGTDAIASADAAGSAAPRPFSDFDPLGLSVGAPVELSAEERQAQSQAAGGTSAGAEGTGTAPGPRDYDGAEDDPLGPGDFVPEEPPSLAGTDPLTVLAWLGAVGGPVALLISAMFWRSAPLLAIISMVAAFAASVVFLIMKLPGEKDEHDDGARI